MEANTLFRRDADRNQLSRRLLERATLLSTTITESDTTERTVSEIGGDTTIKSAATGTPYDDTVVEAVSVASQSVRNTDQYSVTGPIGKDVSKSFLTKIRQLQKPPDKTVESVKPGRKLYIMRHGERLDRIFPEWLQVAITEDGKYKPYDINQPLAMLERVGGIGWTAYEHDSPVTEMGNLSSQMIGRGLKNCHVDIKHVISSPALRCVQTAHALLKASEFTDVKISVERGLFEWLQWYDKMPQWFDPQTLTQTAKHRINETYKPIVSVAELSTKKSESTKEYCQRLISVTKQLLEQTKAAGGNVLVVGHGSTVHVGGRSLVGKSVAELSRTEIEQMDLNYPYCSLIALEE